jgi:WD40-like Beta Propeller Repeat
MQRRRDWFPFGEPHNLAKVADVRVVPYNARAGGVSRAVLGASDPSYLEYEPRFSPDGKLIAFTRAPTGGPDGPFRNRFGEVTVVSAQGGTPAPLVANDPNTCAGDSLPLALLNGSPTWIPSVGHRGGRSYYFLLFTSARKYGDEFSTPFQIGGFDDTGTLRDSTQLYLTTVVLDDKTGSVTSYPAIYLWKSESRRCPGWSWPRDTVRKHDPRVGLDRAPTARDRGGEITALSLVPPRTSPAPASRPRLRRCSEYLVVVASRPASACLRSWAFATCRSGPTPGSSTPRRSSVRPRPSARGSSWSRLSLACAAS